MLYRIHPDSRSEPANLKGIFAGESLFLVAPGPSLRDTNLELLRRRGICTLALNTAYLTFRSTLWLGIDYPECYPLLLYQDPSLVKISRASIAHLNWHGRQLCQYPNIYFLHLTATSRPDDGPLFSEPTRWYPKSFILALQLAWWLGFRTIYTVGTDFRITQHRQYAHGNPLSRFYVNTNRRVYANTLAILRRILPDLAARGVRLVNTTPRSRLDFVEWMRLSDAVEEALSGKAVDMGASPLPHSMAVPRRSPGGARGGNPGPSPVTLHARLLQERFLARRRGDSSAGQRLLPGKEGAL